MLLEAAATVGAAAINPLHTLIIDDMVSAVYLSAVTRPHAHKQQRIWLVGKPN